MDNFDRSEKALRALSAYGGETIEQTMDLTIEHPVTGEVARLPEGYPISDLIADLLHVATTYGVDPMEKINEGIEHWGADIVEQAWEHDDKWHSSLQDPTNIEHAETVLTLNSVPMLYWPGIMTKVGLVKVDDKDSYDDGLSEDG